MEFKCGITINSSVLLGNINRITVEFKFFPSPINYFSTFDINRITVEFKSENSRGPDSEQCEILIESQWNLN